MTNSTRLYFLKFEKNHKTALPSKFFLSNNSHVNVCLKHLQPLKLDLQHTGTIEILLHCNTAGYTLDIL